MLAAFAQCLGDQFKSVVPLKMSIGVIDVFEMIGIYQKEIYLFLLALAPLKLIAKALREGCKHSGRRAIIARYGGDEFVVLASSEDGATNEELKNNINERLAELAEEEKLPFDLTISIGIADLDGDDSLKDLIEKADAAMYDEKKKGS